MANYNEPNNTYTPAILIIAFIFAGSLAVMALVLTNSHSKSFAEDATPSPTPHLEIEDGSALPAKQEIPLEEPSKKTDGQLELDPDLTTKETSIPSVLKDKKLNIPLPN